MKQVEITLKGVDSHYSQSRPHRVPKLDRESAEDYEARTWKHRMHTNEEGLVVLPGIAFKNCIAEAAKYLGMQIPGKGKSTYTKHFEAGIIILHSPLIIGADGTTIAFDDCEEVQPAVEMPNKLSEIVKKKEPEKKAAQVFGDWIFTPSDGVPGSGKRVYRCYPIIRSGWSASITMLIADDIITRSVLEKHLEIAGSLIGLGRWRVRNRGMYGRFEAEINSWKD